MLQPQLQLLVGRPMFFYGYFMPKLWRQLCRERPASPAELYRVLSGSATAATAGARDCMVAFVIAGVAQGSGELRFHYERPVCSTLPGASCAGMVTTKSGDYAEVLGHGVLGRFSACSTAPQVQVRASLCSLTPSTLLAAAR